MAKVYIDISLFTAEAAYGKVSGTLDLAVVPQVGDVIAFRLSEQVNAHVGPRKLPYGGHLRVTDRVIPADRQSDVLVTLEDVTATTVEGAHQLMKMLEQHYGLLGDVWD